MDASVVVSSQAVSPLLRFIDAQDVKNLAFREQLLREQSSPRISIERWWALLEKMSEHYPVPALGIRIGQLFRLEDAGALGYLAASCDYLMDALKKMQRYEAVLHNLSYIRALAQGNTLILQWEGEGAKSTPLSDEFVASSLLTVTKILIGKEQLCPLGIKLTGELSGDLSIYEELLGCPVSTGSSRLAIMLPMSWLSLPINSRNPHLRSILEQQAEAMLAASPGPDSFIRKVQELMLSGLENGQIGAAWIAEQLELSERNFYRLLAERGRRFQDLLDGLRLQLAQRYLGTPELELADISLMLGFSEQSSFSRAFKQWTGKTPLRFRHACLTDLSIGTDKLTSRFEIISR